MASAGPQGRRRRKVVIAMAEAPGRHRVETAEDASGQGQPVGTGQAASRLGKVFELSPAGPNWPHGA